MKKLVQSRWKGCPVSASHVSGVGFLPVSNRCRVAMDRGAFSDVEVSILLHAPDELHSTATEQQISRNGDCLDRTCCDKGASMFSRQVLRSLSESTGLPADAAATTRRTSRKLKNRKMQSICEGRPTERYWELIANVFRSERKAEMKKTDIVTILKSRFPYFQNLRKFESRIGEVLTRNSSFKLLGPGVWGFRGHETAGQVSRSRKRTRVRRRPDFLRIEWRKSGYADGTKSKRNHFRRKRNRTVTSSDSENESAKHDTSFSSSLSFEDQSNNPTAEKTATDHGNISTLEMYKNVLADFNTKILNRVIEEISEANHKCFERLIAAMERTESSPPRRCLKPSKLLHTIGRNNQQLLQETIDKLIAENEKCLMNLNQSEPKKAVAAIPRSTTSLQSDTRTAVSTSDGKEAPTSAATNSQAPNCLSKADSMPSDSDQSSFNTIQAAQAGLTYPLPTLYKRNFRANNHVRFGKRVVPRLTVDSSAESSKNISQSDSSEQDNPHSKKQHSSLHVMKTISPTTHTTRKVRLSMDFSKNQIPTNRVSPIFEDPKEVVDNLSETTDKKKSVNDAFAEYARRNSELNDIVAMIDPSLSKSMSSQENQTSAPKDDLVYEESTLVNADKRRSRALVPSSTTSQVDTSVSSKQGLLGGESSKKRRMDNVTARTINNSSDRIEEIGKRDPQVCKSSKSVISSSTTTNSRTVSSSLSTNTNLHLSTRLTSVSNSQTSRRPIQPRPQTYSVSRPRSDANNRGIDIRYIPPYQWGYRPTSNVTQQSSEVASRFVPRGLHSYRLLYPSARPNMYRDSIGTHISLNSAAPCQRRNALNNVHCRIRGATVLRLPVRK